MHQQHFVLLVSPLRLLSHNFIFNHSSVRSLENVCQVLLGTISSDISWRKTASFYCFREVAKKSFGMSGQFSTDNINLVTKKSPLAMSSLALTAPTATKPKVKSSKQQTMESVVENEIERDGLRIPKKIDSTWAVSKVLIQKKGKVALKDLRRFNELTSENQRGLNRQRKVAFFVAFEEILYVLMSLGNDFLTRCQSNRR